MTARFVPPPEMEGFRPSSGRATLLVFTLGEHQETFRRGLLPPRWRAEENRLHRACLENALDAGRDAGLQLEISSPQTLDIPADTTFRQQVGGGFGPRLRQALDGVFRSSAGGPVVLVGTDVPGLTADHLQTSLGALRQDPDAVVLGPSPDGGIYLLAAAKPLDEALDDVRWCCRYTLLDLRRSLARRGRRVVLLPTLRDLDQRRDLEQWLADGTFPTLLGRWAALRRDLAQMLARLRTSGEQNLHSSPLRRTFSTAPLRGPPRAFVAVS